ncbi:hypothetical protein P7K49_019127, partial [Saguinus oedipus]
ASEEWEVWDSSLLEDGMSHQRSTRWQVLLAGLKEDPFSPRKFLGDFSGTGWWSEAEHYGKNHNHSTETTIPQRESTNNTQAHRKLEEDRAQVATIYMGWTHKETPASRN